MSKEIKTITQYKTQLKKDIRQAIRDCKKAKRENNKTESGINRDLYEMDLDGKIYAYEFVLDCLIDDVGN